MKIYYNATLIWKSGDLDIKYSEYIDEDGSLYNQNMEIQYWHKESDILLLVTLYHLSWIDILFCSITPTNLGQLSKPGTVSESSCPEDSKTVPGR